MELKVLNKAIDALRVKNAEVEGTIQTLGVECIKHLEAHGDSMPMNRLVLALRRGQHQAFLTWAMAYSHLVRNTDKVTKESQPLVKGKDKKNDVEGAIANPWFELQDSVAAGTAKAFDLQAAMRSLIKRAAGHVDKETADKLISMGKIAGVPTDKLVMAKGPEVEAPKIETPAEPVAS